MSKNKELKLKFKLYYIVIFNNEYLTCFIGMTTRPRSTRPEFRGESRSDCVQEQGWGKPEFQIRVWGWGRGVLTPPPPRTT
jgi:hypothetical protein